MARSSQLKVCGLKLTVVSCCEPGLAPLQAGARPGSAGQQPSANQNQRPQSAAASQSRPTTTAAAYHAMRQAQMQSQADAVPGLQVSETSDDEPADDLQRARMVFAERKRQAQPAATARAQQPDAAVRDRPPTQSAQDQHAYQTATHVVGSDGKGAAANGNANGVAASIPAPAVSQQHAVSQHGPHLYGRGSANGQNGEVSVKDSLLQVTDHVTEAF